MHPVVQPVYKHLVVYASGSYLYGLATRIQLETMQNSWESQDK